MSLFEKYLDGCDDAPTLELEIGQLDCFLDCFDVMDMVDHQDADVLAKNKVLTYPFTVETNRQMLFDLIRNVWDVAYSHGEHDALIGEGVSLAEIVAEEE